jgi:hypothetical protein
VRSGDATFGRRRLSWTQQSQFDDVWMVGGSGPTPTSAIGPVRRSRKKLVAGGNKEATSGFSIRRRRREVNLGAGSAFAGGVFVAVAWDGARLLTVCNGATSTEPGSEPAPMGRPRCSMRSTR